VVTVELTVEVTDDDAVAVTVDDPLEVAETVAVLDFETVAVVEADEVRVVEPDEVWVEAPLDVTEEVAVEVAVVAVSVGEVVAVELTDELPEDDPVTVADDVTVLVPELDTEVVALPVAVDDAELVAVDDWLVFEHARNVESSRPCTASFSEAMLDSHADWSPPPTRVHDNRGSEKVPDAPGHFEISATMPLMAAGPTPFAVAASQGSWVRNDFMK